MKQCPRCHNEPAIIHAYYGVLIGAKCVAEDAKLSITKPAEFYSPSKQDRIQKQRDKFEKDLVQPFAGNKPNPKFVEAYPDKLDSYFTPEQIKKL